MVSGLLQKSLQIRHTVARAELFRHPLKRCRSMSYAMQVQLRDGREPLDSFFLV